MATPREIQSHIDRAKTGLIYQIRSGRHDISAGDVRSVLDNLCIDIRGGLPSEIGRLKPPTGSYVNAQTLQEIVDKLGAWHRELGRQSARR